MRENNNGSTDVPMAYDIYDEGLADAKVRKDKPSMVKFFVFTKIKIYTKKSAINADSQPLIRMNSGFPFHIHIYIMSRMKKDMNSIIYILIHQRPH